MLAHTFISVPVEKIELALFYYYLPESKRRAILPDVLLVNDRYITSKTGLFLFTNIDVFVQKWGNQSDLIDYHGKTIFPPASISELIFRMEQKRLVKSRQWSKLYSFLCNSNEKGNIVIHLGI